MSRDDLFSALRKIEKDRNRFHEIVRGKIKQDLKKYVTHHEMLGRKGKNVVSIPMHAFVDSDPPSDEDVRRFFAVVLDPGRRPVFVHCAQGKDRTGTMCALYRIEIQGWTNERALAEMRGFGFHEIYGDLERFVRDYRPRGFAARK